MPRVKCNNNECRFYDKHKCTKTKIEIGYDGCNSFEKGIVYYFHLVWDKLDHTNMILACDLTDELRIGLYYVTDCFHLGFKETEWGYERILTLHREEGDKGLTKEDIFKIDIDMERLTYHIDKFEAGILPPYSENQTKPRPAPKVTSQPFGWLSPTGKFIERDWGEHEEAARNIVEENNWGDEYDQWLIDTDQKYSINYRDFISEVKGYVLIHNPGGYGGYIVSHRKPFTKKQKDFLYNYFADLGDYFKAEQYLEEN